MPTKASTAKKSTTLSPLPTPVKGKKATDGKPTAGQKFCKRHDTFHSLDSFANDRSSKDGKYSICKDAEREDRAAKKLRAQAASAPAPIAAAPAAKKSKAAKK